jgi:CheY-like chemotaxis protein
VDTHPQSVTTLLLVDDDPAVRRVVGRALERFGYRVVYAADGAEALALLEQHGGAVDLVISDSNMPVMTGSELYRALRGSGRTLRFLCASGGPIEPIEEAADPRWRVLQKPFTLDELLLAVREMLAA